MTADDAQMAADIALTAPGLAPIHTAIVESRRIFRRLRAYVVYRVALTVQLVGFLCIVSAVYDQTIEPFYVIVLALAHDLTIVCIAYDNQSASSAPERLEIAPLLIVSYALGLGSPSAVHANAHHGACLFPQVCARARPRPQQCSLLLPRRCDAPVGAHIERLG